MTQTLSSHGLRQFCRTGFLVFSILLPTVLAAQLPSARLDTLFPPGGRQGKTVEVSLGGVDLDEPSRLLFSHAGLTAQKVASPGAARFIVAVGTNVPVGNYEVRALGRFGLSNPRVFAVGDLAEILESTTNQTAATAQPVSIGTIVDGRIQPAKSDYFRFDAKQGQRILIECEAAELDSRLEPTLWIYSGAGKELDRSRRSGCLDFTAPADGAYTVRLHDFLNRGGDDYFYRLAISSRPHLDFAVPFVIQPNSNQTVTLFGRNLPGGLATKLRSADGRLLQRLEVKSSFPEAQSGLDSLHSSRRLPVASGGIDAWDYRLPSKNGISNPLLFSGASSSVSSEVEPNDLPAQAQKLAGPTELVGFFQRPNDSDWFQFEAKKGEVWILEIQSQQLGFVSDPALSVYRVSKNDKGVEQLSDVTEAYDSDANFGGIDFKTSSGDPSARVEIKEDGTYRLLVSDQSSASNEQGTRGYRLSLRKPAPRFRLVATPMPPPPANKDSKELKVSSTWIRKGGTVAVRVLAFRQDGMNQEITLRAEGLPSGVTCSGGRLTGDAKSGLIFFHAEDTVSNWAGAIRIVGESPVGEVTQRQVARAATMVWGAANYELEGVSSRLTDDFDLAVSSEEETPLGLQLADGKPLEAVSGGKVTLPITVLRHADFPNNTKLRLVGHPALGGGKELEVDKKATNGVIELDLAALKMPDGQHSLYLETLTQVQGYRSVEGYRAAEAAKGAQEKALPQLKASLEKAKTAESEAQKREQQAELDAKAAPEKEPALKQAREAKAAASGEVKTITQQLEATQQRATEAEEKLKAYARKDFTDTFYSMPIALTVKPAKPAAPSKP